MEKEKSGEAMWKQIFQIQKYDLLNWLIESWNEILTLGDFSFNFENFLRTLPVAASLKFQILLQHV